MVNTIRKEMVHIALTESEKKDVIKHAKAINMSISEYIRQSIFDKMRLSDYPDLVKNQKSDFSENQVKIMMESLSTNTEKINLIMEKMNVITKIEDRLKALSSLVNREELKEKELKIIELLKEHKKLKPIKIIKLSGFSSEVVQDIITNDKIFSVDNRTGEIKLND